MPGGSAGRGRDFMMSTEHANDNFNREIFYQANRLEAQFHYRRRELDYWTLTINQGNEFGFYLPNNIIAMWKEQNFDKQVAINLKQQFFSKVFIFTSNNTDLPFRIVNIDRQWLNEINDRQE